jgi:hypothetical protein
LARDSDLDVWFPLLPNTNDMKERIEEYSRKGRDTCKFNGTLQCGQNVFLVGNSSGKRKNSSFMFSQNLNVYLICSNFCIVEDLHTQIAVAVKDMRGSIHVNDACYNLKRRAMFYCDDSVLEGIQFTPVSLPLSTV